MFVMIVSLLFADRIFYAAVSTYDLDAVLIRALGSVRRQRE
ncbi:hypothetical protein [Leptospira gomenensis]|nr:hypothetical protein [Leptospira gomenensis]